MNILRLPGHDPGLNLATEEYIFRRGPEEDCLLLWRNHNTIVVGRHQNSSAEINRAFVEEQDIRVVRRITGGGAVYHDLGNLNFSFITGIIGSAGVEEGGQTTLERFTQPIAAALRGLGLPAETSGRNDILAAGRKISGNAQALHQRRLLHHGTLLFDSDLSVLSRALHVQEDKIVSKGIQSVRSRVANIREFLPDPDFSIENLAEEILASLTRNRSVRELRLSRQDLEAIRALSEEKYASWEWNFGRSPPCNFRNRRRYPGGSLETLLEVREGRLAACSFFGDFLALRPAEEAAERLLGLRYDRQELREALLPLPLHEYFGNITLEEALDCLLGATEDPPTSA